MLISRTGVKLNMEGELKDGYCRVCDDITETGIDEDAVDLTCPECRNNSLMSITIALIRGHVSVYEDSDLDVDEDSYSDLEPVEWKEDIDSDF